MSSTITCIYVDDDPGVRDLVSLNLRMEGVEVHAVEHGEQIEDLVRDVQPDLVLLDVMMPGRDGYDILSSLKADEEMRDIPVILLTAKATDAEIWQGWQSGADYYLTKPFNVDHLTEYLRIAVRADRRRRGRKRVPDE